MNQQLAINRIVESLKAGRVAECADACRAILERSPNEPDVMHVLGLAMHATGDRAAALHWIDRAILVNPACADYHNNRGAVLRNLNREAEAVEAFKRALEIKPDFIVVWQNLGGALHRLNRCAEAAEALGHVLAAEPENVAALNEMSMVLNKLGRFEESLQMGRRAFAIRPDEIEAMDNIAIALRSMDRRTEAIEFYRRAIRLRPDKAILHNNLGTLLKEKNFLEEAMACCERAIQLDGNLAQAHNNLGVALKDQGRLDECIACHERAQALWPHSEEIASNRIYTMHFHPGIDALAIRAALEQFNQKWRCETTPCENDRSPERRLRIGYVSPDFREHVVGWNILPMLEKHDHERFEIFCYSDVRRADVVTHAIRGCADQWRSILGKTHDEAAAMIREDRIDILVDLTLHMNGNRLMLFARKPAPIQVTYLGYCGSTGLEAVDYRFSDRYLDPPGTDELYCEKTVRLPTSYWCYRPGGNTPDVTPLGETITFACLNNFCKVSAGSLELWGKILRQTPNSRLLIHSQPGVHLDGVRRRFGDRVEFVGTAAFEQYVGTFQRAAISLDPFPYGGGITTCDSLWMGVPVVTLAGKMPVGRAGVTLLSQVGLTELIAQTPEEYVKIAVGVARDRARLEELRGTLRERMRQSPLMDASRLARDVEEAYRWMWRQWIKQ